MTTIIELEVVDLRFPTSRALDGSDAMNPDPDYSAAYVILRTDAGDGLEGHGLTFTIGRGTEVVVAAVEALRPLVVGLDVEAPRPTSARSGGRWSPTASCAGSGPRRARSTSRLRRSSTRSGTWSRSAPASPSGGCWPT